MRLQEAVVKYYGVSRRKAGELIKSGYVRVNGEKVLEPWREVSEKDEIAVRGKIIKILPQPRVLIALYKPKEILSSMVFEERGKKGLLYLMKKNGLATFLRDVKKLHRLFPVGRLDYDSEGLILLTNDGALANELAHPSRGVPKEYVLDVLFCGSSRGQRIFSRASSEWEKILSSKERLDDGVFEPDSLKIEKIKYFEYEGIRFAVVLKLRVRIHSGKKRILKRFFRAKGGVVLRLIRVSMGDYNLGGLRPGQWRVEES